MTDTKGKGGSGETDSVEKSGDKSPKNQRRSGENNNNNDEDDDSRVAAGDENRSKEFKHLVEFGLETKVASRLDEIFKTGKLLHSDLDDRALDALKEFPADGALSVLSQFLDSNLEHVSNKSAFLCGAMKTYRQKYRNASGGGGGQASSSANGGGGSPQASSSASGANGSGNPNSAAAAVKGPDEAKIKEILERTGYTLDVTTGQRKFGGPPPDWEGDPPGNGCEVFCGKIPRDIYESDLIPLFEKCGKIWDLRLMMDPITGLNRGYAFVTFTTKEAAQEAVKQLDSYEIGEGKPLKVNVSEPKTRLFIGNIPKSKGRDNIEEEFSQLSAGLREVIIYSSPDDRRKNRGFCFLEYESHKAASLAKRRLESGRVKVWNCDIIVDWADPQEEPDDETMSQVKVLYVRNLTTTVTEGDLQNLFVAHGNVVRVKKIKDYAFIHFAERSQALAAMEALNHTEFIGTQLEVSLAKPPSDKKKKEELLRKREQRMMKAMSHNLALPPFHAFQNPYLPMGAIAATAGGGPMYRGGGGAPHGGNGRGGGNGNSSHSGNSNGGAGAAAAAAAAAGIPRNLGRAGGVFDNNWQWGAWGVDGSWTHHHHHQAAQHRGGPIPHPWIGIHEGWAGPHMGRGAAHHSFGWNAAANGPLAVAGNYGGLGRIDGAVGGYNSGGYNNGSGGNIQGRGGGRKPR